MKYAFFFLFLFSVISTPLYARSIHSFKDSEALMNVALFMNDSSEDLKTPTYISDKKINVSRFVSCTECRADEIVSEVASAINRLNLFYPDEDIAFDQALIDLEDYLDHRIFKKCYIVRSTPGVKILQTYYQDFKDEVHLSIIYKTFL